MKHLAIDVRMVHASGIGTFLKTLLEGLSHETDLALTLLHTPRDREFLKRYSPHSLVEVRSPIYSLREQWELPRKIPECDVFWSPHFNVPLLPIRAKKRLTTIHDVFHLAYHLPFAQKLYAKILYNAACALSDHVTTDSNFSREEILRLCRWHPKRLNTIPLGVDKRFGPCRLHECVREKYQLPDSFLLSVSNGKPHKNLARLIEALPVGEHLVLVGMEERGIKQKNVHFTGSVPGSDLPALYSAASAFVFPSLYEGFGYPPLAAMACGCPVIVAEAGSLPEVCHEAAEYVNPRDTSSIRAGIERVLYDPSRRQELIERGFIRVKSFELNKMYRKYAEVIDACCCCA